jgi:hypothetical protein
MKKLILVFIMASFATFISAQNSPQAPADKPKADQKAPNEDTTAKGVPDQPVDDSQKLSDGTKKANVKKADEGKVKTSKD